MIGNIASSAYATMAQSTSRIERPEPPPKPSAADMFSAIDTDGDGQITETELSGVLGRDQSDNAARLLSALDGDGSGTISTDEFASLAEDVLGQLDAQRSMHRPPPPAPDGALSESGPAASRPPQGPPPGPPPDEAADPQQFIATVLNQYLITSGLSDDSTSGLSTLA